MSPHRGPDDTIPHTSPLDRMLRRKSPYDGLFIHAAKVAECVRLLETGYNQYANREYEAFAITTQRISELEHEADKLRSSVLSHLPRHIFMSASRTGFELLLHDQDTILDDVEDLVERMDLRHTTIPDALQPKLLELVRLVIATVDEYEKAVEVFADVLATGFGDSAREEAKEHVKAVHRKEFEADRQRFVFLRALHAMEDELKPLDVIHLVLFADLLDNVADHAENAADRVRALIAQ